MTALDDYCDVVLVHTERLTATVQAGEDPRPVLRDIFTIQAPEGASPIDVLVAALAAQVRPTRRPIEHRGITPTTALLLAALVEAVHAAQDYRPILMAIFRSATPPGGGTVLDAVVIALCWHIPDEATLAERLAWSRQLGDPRVLEAHRIHAAAA